MCIYTSLAPTDLPFCTSFVSLLVETADRHSCVVLHSVLLIARFLIVVSPILGVLSLSTERDA